MIPCKIDNVVISKTAAEFVSALQPHFKKSIEQAIRRLAHNPFLGIQLKGKLYGLRKKRVGKYRILYNFTHNNFTHNNFTHTTLNIVDIGDRKDIYR